MINKSITALEFLMMGQQPADKGMGDQRSEDINSFGEFLGKIFFQRPATELTREEFNNIVDILFSIDQWKKANGKEAFAFADAYALMNGASIH